MIEKEQQGKSKEAKINEVIMIHKEIKGVERKQNRV